MKTFFHFTFEFCTDDPYLKPFLKQKRKRRYRATQAREAGFVATTGWLDERSSHLAQIPRNAPLPACSGAVYEAQKKDEKRCENLLT